MVDHSADVLQITYAITVNILVFQGYGVNMALNLTKAQKAQFPFIGGSYQARSWTQDNSRTVNLYPELHGYGVGTNDSPAALYSRYGLKFLQSLNPGPIRGTYTLSNTQLSFIVSGNSVWQIASGTGIPIQLTGNLTTSSGYVSMIDNGTTLLIVDGTNGYTYDFGGVSAVTTYGSMTGGSGYTDGTYYGVPFTGGTGTLAVATIVTVSGGAVTSFTLGSGGYGYTVGDVLSFSPSFDGAGLGSGFSITVTSVASTPVLNTINDPHFYNGATTCTYQGGYLICNQYGTNIFFFSNVDAATWPPLNIASVDTYSDVVVAMQSNNQELYALCSKTIQIWSANPNATASAPFAPISGRSVNIGLVAPGTVKQIAGTFLWLGASDQGSGIVYSMSNDTPTRVSNHSIEYRLQQLGNLSTSIALTYQQDGHQFYALNCPGAGTTYVYDLTTEQWVEFQSSQNGVSDRWWPSSHCYVAGTHIFGDYRNGNIYTMVDGFWMDNDQPLIRIRQCPHSTDGVQMCFYKTLQIFVQAGTGTQTVDPRYVLEISRDGGQTYSNPIYASAGKIGQYQARARWQRLGRGRDVVFRVSCSDPVNVVMLDAFLDWEDGTN